MGRYLEVPGADYSAIAIGKVTPIVGKVAIDVVASPNNGGTTSGTGMYEIGSSVSISATPASGYKFVKWSDGVTTRTRNIVVGEIPMTYTAEFADNKVYLSNEDNFVVYNKMYGDTTTNTWKRGGQNTRVYPVLIKAGSKIEFGSISQQSRHGISDSATPTEGGTLSYSSAGSYTTFTTTKDGYLYICTPEDLSGSHPTWEELISENGYFSITEP